VFPLIFLALGVGAFVLGLSSHARVRTEDYVRAILAAHAAHREADMHLSKVNKAPVQDTASRSVDHALAATLANQRAAQGTVDAARIAQTGAERNAVADSAAKVQDRGKRIEEALANLGVGQCGARSYSGVTPQIRDAILAKLHAEGMVVTGEDPWDIDTQVAGVKLRAVWDPGAQVLRLVVTASAFFAPCDAIWGRIDRALHGIIGA
jgi:hypothetical protein